MRAEIRAEVASIVPLDDQERASKQEVLDWIDSGAEIYRIEKPDTPPKHLVSYVVLVDGEYLLLVDHINAELWVPTGGHVDPDEHPRVTALREAKEELGIDGEFLHEHPLFVSVTETVGKTAGHQDVSIWYTLKGDRQQSLKFDDSEFYSVRWFHKDDIPFDRADKELDRFLRKLYPFGG